MITDFVNAYEAYFEKQIASLTPEQIKEYQRYALSNRDRGKDFIKFLEESTGLSLQANSVLDIGSAYGGFVIECAQRGAEAYGVDKVKVYHDLALENAKNEPGRSHFILGNFLDESTLRQIDGIAFDLIVVNDVFEHVYDYEHLFSCIKRLSGQETLLYFTIPNAGSYGGILREHHRFVFGLTLLDPGIWSRVIGDYYMYYRPLSLYRMFFADTGYNYLYIKAEDKKVETCRQRIEQAFEEIDKRLSDAPFSSEDLAIHARNNFKRHKEKYANDLKTKNDLELYLLYEAHMWEGFATKKPWAMQSNKIKQLS